MTMARQDHEFAMGVRVYYEDTDASGVVYHASYLRYFERARTEWLEQFGPGHTRLARGWGIAFTLADLSLRFVRPARLDDRLIVTAVMTRCSAARILFEQQVLCQDTLLVKGQFTVACVNIEDFRPCRLPEALFKEPR